MAENNVTQPIEPTVVKETTMPYNWDAVLYGIGSTVIYFVICVVLFLAAVWIMEKVTPFSIRKEIEEDQNTALGIVIGCALIAIAVVIHGVLTSG